MKTVGQYVVAWLLAALPSICNAQSVNDSSELYPGERVYTFWDYFRQHWQKNSGLRIDHLLLNPRLSSQLADAGVDTWVRGQPGASDHAPTWVRLQSATPP